MEIFILWASILSVLVGVIVTFIILHLTNGRGNYTSSNSDSVIMKCCCCKCKDQAVLQENDIRLQLADNIIEPSTESSELSGRTVSGCTHSSVSTIHLSPPSIQLSPPCILCSDKVRERMNGSHHNRPERAAASGLSLNKSNPSKSKPGSSPAKHFQEIATDVASLVQTTSVTSGIDIQSQFTSVERDYKSEQLPSKEHRAKSELDASQVSASTASTCLGTAANVTLSSTETNLCSRPRLPEKGNGISALGRRLLEFDQIGVAPPNKTITNDEFSPELLAFKQTAEAESSS